MTEYTQTHTHTDTLISLLNDLLSGIKTQRLMGVCPTGLIVSRILKPPTSDVLKAEVLKASTFIQRLRSISSTMESLR